MTDAFADSFEVLETIRQRLAGADGFFEVRLAADGTASAFAIDT